jgi:hemerythrin
MHQANDYLHPKRNVETIDLTHRWLLNEIATLDRVDDQEFIRSYPSLIAAVEHDFRQEEALMEETNFAAFHLHLEQHARALGALHWTVTRVCSGETETGREAIALLREWLLFHIPTMDKALADAVRTLAGPR